MKGYKEGMLGVLCLMTLVLRPLTFADENLESGGGPIESHDDETAGEALGNGETGEEPVEEATDEQADDDPPQEETAGESADGGE